MDDFKKAIHKLDVDEFKTSKVVPSDDPGPHDTVPAQFFCGGCFRCGQCFSCFRCFNCFQCFNCFRCSNCFRCARCF
ncbi:heterocycloanthracin/sonorensin family bacteriocin [Alicyclobacillus macrosporangiidus]|uniref:Bacteriocin, heterocycloanthracin/sonorensin family n=1 Tax=Alicyclobacillus macrosporangiidus TaxID=392015 RepID=A0A1I7JUV7_9BACL|nr:heterocycloanthracin/sonorensin family bacteriocin [Alicyclobacillus macrosporangiidus]SFU88982.1 bacteriocin, heterocycloanthracin/sonorensin family [Alicyclobacillus macrosporangiidus]